MTRALYNSVFHGVSDTYHLWYKVGCITPPSESFGVKTDNEAAPPPTRPHRQVIGVGVVGTDYVFRTLLHLISIVITSFGKSLSSRCMHTAALYILVGM